MSSALPPPARDRLAQSRERLRQALRAAPPPLAERHPLGLVLGALLLGGLLVWRRPWQGLLKPALLAGVLPQLLSKVVAGVPLQSWLAAWTAWTAHQRKRRKPPAP